ncbi:glycosyl transferase, group 1 family protein [Synechococcus sp. PCC 7335]|uniref:glycosyltransferase n=1 Tax=Synechococcus sp. (strain ATCC 29403 / PCC 7335) TaxID=91464 RepID=UPI00017ED282|nr:glycosyltransferase [Synechococcus sp. PCC 7335]EDX86383.1 glycosyl transferase, group 1 family protein [Synechococcus sp. PCC 7335]
MSLALAIARNAASHEVWILLNDRFPRSVPAIRQWFNPLVPREHIVVFSIPPDTRENNPKKNALTRVSEQVRELFISTLQPDIVHISNLFEGWEDDVVVSISSSANSLVNARTPTSITLYDLRPLTQPEVYSPNEAIRRYYRRKVESLRRSQLLLTVSESLRREAIELLDIAPTSVINLSTAEGPQFHSQIKLQTPSKNIDDYCYPNEYSLSTWDQAARQAIAAFERVSTEANTYATSEQLYAHFIAKLSDETALQNQKESDLRILATCISTNLGIYEKQLLVDISQLVLLDEKSGIQRVVRSILVHLLQAPPNDYRVIPVYWDGWQYRQAREFISQMLPKLGSKQTSIQMNETTSDPVVDVNCNDIFLGLDHSAHLAPNTQETLQHFRDLGAEIYFVIYDILLVRHPEWWAREFSTTFHRWLKIIAEISTGLVCISEATAHDIKDWLLHTPPQRVDALRIISFHLGADISQSLPSKGLPQDAEFILQTLQSAPSLLIVSTLEPRKGHSQALEAFNLLWQSGLKINLVIVGREGWQVKPLIAQLNHHPEKDKQLFWLQGISDEYLSQIYLASTALLSPSEGEGFGLPLIEAAQHHLPIIARSLPVYKEVAGDYAFYFEGNQPEPLAEAIKTWLSLYDAGKAPSSKNMPYLTWAESTQQLVDAILPS